MTEAAYTHNGQPIAAEAFYAIACDPRRSVAVEACAGAGKTWMLVSRMVRALLDGQTQPHEILAITFTKKAAGEMRERLYDWLAEFAQADDETLAKELEIRGLNDKNGLQSNENGRKQLLNLYQQVLTHGRQVQIRTFHSWFAALLHTAPMACLQQLGLPLDYELLEDDAPAKALVWRRFYGALLKSPKLKADFEAVVQTHGRFQTEKALSGALDKRSEFMLADSAGVVDVSVQHFSVVFPDFAHLAHPHDALVAGPVNTLFLAAAKVLGTASARTISAAGVELERALSLGDADAALSALLTDKGSARKFNDKIVGLEIIRQAQDAALRVLAAASQHHAWDYQLRMARLSRLLLAEFAALKRQRGWVDMNDVERAAQVMLSDTVLSGWVQERLDANIRHLMIDEFQDTNPLQWQALSNWLSGYAGASRAPGVFIVGDPKQSIYRFRRAEPQVFIAAQRFMRDALGGDVLACDHTRRSSHAVVATVNTVMAEAQRNNNYDGFRAHTTASGEAGRVLRLPAILRADHKQAPGLLNAQDAPDAHETGPWRDSLDTPRELLDETLKTLEARQAAAWIKSQIDSGIAPADVMALSRRRSSLLPLLVELRALHVPAQVGEKTRLIDCCEVQDMVALLDVLVSPQHDLSLARALRSPLFNVSTDALVEIVLAINEAQGHEQDHDQGHDQGGNSTKPKLSWYELLQTKELSAPGLIGLGSVLTTYKALLDALPPHDALQAIFDQGDVLARYGAAAPAASRAAVLSNLQSLLTQALQVDGGRYATPYAFVRALKAGGLQAPAAVNPDAVRLLTIHGAKGLEAHAVLLLDTDTAPRPADSMSVLVDWPGEAPAPQKFVFLVSEKTPPACAASTLANEQAARAREELNALYVAMTRAKNTLAISSIEPFRAAPSSWWQRLCPLADIAEVLPPPLLAPGTTQSQATFCLPGLPAFISNFDAAPPLALEADTPSAQIGKAMHRLLEWHDFSDEAVSRAAFEFGLTAEQAEQAQKTAKVIRHGAGAWAWDESVVQWQGNEVELTHRGVTFRLDRLVQRADTGHAGQWWVLDFKSNANPQTQPALVAKMRMYVAALEAVYPGQIVKAAFLTSDGRVWMVD